MFKSIRDSLTRTRDAVFGRVATLLGQSDITDDTWEQLEIALIQADMGAAIGHEMIGRLRARASAEGIVNAGADRFRPVMMTALTTILGLVPMAAATSGSGATFAGLGRALIGGLTVGTVLTLVVVPVFYSLIDEFQGWCIGFLGSFKRRDPVESAGATASD